MTKAAGSPKHPKKMTSKLVAISSAAVLTVYTAGYVRTKSAAERIAGAEAPRRSAAPVDVSRPAPASSAPEYALNAQQETTPSEPTMAVAPRPTEVSPRGGASPASPVAAGPSSPAPVAAPVAMSTEATASAVAEPAAASAAATSPSVAVDTIALQTDHKVVEPTAAVTAPAPAATTAIAAAAALASPVPAPAPATPSAPAKPKYKDGTYTGWGTCRHGDIQAEVVIADGHIASAKIAQCWTRYSCNWLDPIVPQVAARQSPNVDYVSGATQSTDAFYYAVIDALMKAK